MKLKKSVVVKAWLPVIIWMGIIFLFSHQPGDMSGASSGRIVELISSGIARLIPFMEVNEDLLHFLFRKGAHFGVYAVLGMLCVRAFQMSGYSGKRGVVYGLILASFYAGTDEYHQTFIPGRSGEVADVMIDSAGAVTGIGFYLLVKGIQFPERAGKHSLQYLLMQDGREEEINNDRKVESQDESRDGLQGESQDGLQDELKEKPAGKLKKKLNKKTKDGSGAKAVDRLKKNMGRQEK